MDILIKIILFLALASMLFSLEQSTYSNKHFIAMPKQFEVGLINTNKMYKNSGESNIKISSLRYGVSKNLEIIYLGIKYRFLHIQNSESALLLKINDYGNDTLKGTFYLIETGLLDRYYHNSHIIIDSGILFENEFSDIYKDSYNYKIFIEPIWRYNDKLNIATRVSLSKKYDYEKDYENNILNSFQDNKQLGLILSYYLNKNTDVNIGYTAQNKTSRIKINNYSSRYTYNINNFFLEVRWRY